jgi:HlyD family secretion protein
VWRTVLAATLACLAGACARDDGIVRMVGSVERTLIEIAAPVSETLVELPVRPGSSVAPGAVVARLDATLAVADVAVAAADLARVQAAAELARHDLARARDLRRKRVTSEQDLERADLAAKEAAAHVAQAEARLAAGRKRVVDLTLVAPVSGVVDQLPFDLGERVPAGAVVAVLLRDGEPWVRVWLPERFSALVRPGTPAEVRVDGIAAVLRARVLDVAREPEFTPHYALTERERVHLVYETRIVLDGAPADLRPGMPAEVAIDVRALGAGGAG